MTKLYLERSIPLKNVNQFWSGWVEDNFATIQVGTIERNDNNERVMKLGRSMELRCDTSDDAVKALVAEYRNKRSGYFFPVSQKPSDFVGKDEAIEAARRVTIDPTTIETPSNYSLYWEALSPVSPQAIETAYSDALRIVDELEFSDVSVSLDMGRNDEQPLVTFREKNVALQFGFIPEAAYENLGGRDQKAINRNDFTIMPAFLTPAGLGRGVLTTNGEVLDLVVRVFLKALSRLTTHFKVSCDFNINWSDPFALRKWNDCFKWGAMDLDDALISIGVKPETVSSISMAGANRAKSSKAAIILEF